MSDLDQWRSNIVKALEAQSKDETLWNASSIGEAYIMQSLRWLHHVIEENDEQALQSIINQANG